MSRRPRTPDVWWPQCGNYDRPDLGLGRDHLRSRTYEQTHRISTQEAFCNRVQWHTEDYLESIAYPLLNEWHRPVFCFGSDGEVTACRDDKFRAYASINDPRWFTEDYIRYLQAELLRKKEWSRYQVVFMSEHHRHSALLSIQELLLDEAAVSEQDRRERVSTWVRELRQLREADAGDIRCILAHVKATLPDLKRQNSTASIFPAAVIRSPDRISVWLHVPRNLLTWRIATPILGHGLGPYINDVGLLSPWSMSMDEAQWCIYRIDLQEDPESAQIEFISRDGTEKQSVQLDLNGVIGLELLQERFPAQTALGANTTS